jgi:NADH-quinone oxidoreductase subunit A
VEIIFFYPWATVFSDTVASQSPAGAVSGTVLLLEMLVFTGILLVAYLYAWGKGVFKWD